MNFNFIGDIFFPPACVQCGDSIARGVLCATCRESIDGFDTLFCGLCSARLPERKKICHRDSPYILGAAGRYDDDALRALIHALKFQGIMGAAEPLSEILVAYVARIGLDLHDYTAVPVPLSKERARARGFNQSALIAERFGACAGLRVEKNVLVRIRHTKPHSETADAAERRRNILGCFAVRRPPPEKIILVDDVVTTGSTFEEAARTLRAGGAIAIVAIAAARS